jgi:hypothetical protein
MSDQSIRAAKLETAVRIARTLMDALGIDIDAAVRNEAIPAELRDKVREALAAEGVIRLRDPLLVEDQARQHTPWLPAIDREKWYYWPRLRTYLIDGRAWPEPTVRSVDDVTDRILGAMESPGMTEFSTKGLVVGYVQSGKTANYTALIAKAVDCGYRLVVVLTGIHNSLRLQTQYRLTEELVGVDRGKPVGVGRPAADREWHTFTGTYLSGDFNPGHANAAALSGPSPVLIVAKKNAPVLDHLLQWLRTTQPETRRLIPTLVIDDEADLASVNTGGNTPPADADAAEDEQDTYEEQARPTRINEQIRTLLSLFGRVAYVAYTATPFANVLIDHRAVDYAAGEDLYPRSFICALPRPYGYYGAEDIFGANDSDGLDVIRQVPEEEVALLVPRRQADAPVFAPAIPPSLKEAIRDFALAGAARASRGDAGEPATMLIHTSYYTAVQQALTRLVQCEVRSLRDEWRYARHKGLLGALMERWETDFRRVIVSTDVNPDCSFADLFEHIGPFLELVQVRQVNSASEDELDYVKDPSLKVVVVGGNRLSRGLTLEGLLVSYFVRSSRTYDTLMQMGRWFGYRKGYVDLTRIFTTPTLEQWFRDLAVVEQELREEIAQYDQRKLTPLDLGVKIRKHSSMLVTSPLKMQAAQSIHISFSGDLIQTINFPFSDRDWLARNIDATQAFLSSLGRPCQGFGTSRPIWRAVGCERVLSFLQEYQMDATAVRVRADMIRNYIARQVGQAELTSWLVAVMGLTHEDPELGGVNLGVVGSPTIAMMERTKLAHQNSFKVITSPDDQRIGLSDEQLRHAQKISQERGIQLPRAHRALRSPEEGVLLLYPISRCSGYKLRNKSGGTREPIYVDPDQGENVIGAAIIFPYSQNASAVEYVVGPVGIGVPQ